MKTPDYTPVHPAMADDWREHILPVFDAVTFPALSFRTLAAKVQEHIEAKQLTPRGTIANAVLAMAAEGELCITDQDNIVSNFR